MVHIYYRVTALNSAGSSAYSNVQSVVVNVTSLNAPVIGAVNNNGSGTYVVSWSSVTGANSYTLKENGTVVYTGSGASYSVTNKAIGSYTYVVTASNGSLVSPVSNSVVVNVTVPPVVAKTFVEGYWESWDSSTSIADIVSMKVDVINIAFGTFTSTGTNTFIVSGLDCDMTTLTSFVSAAHTAGKKVKISIGGATFGLSGMLTSTAAAQGMANAVAAFVTANNLDGWDLDCEDYPDYLYQVQLIQYTRAALGPNYLISYTPKTPASTTLPYASVIQGAVNYYSYLNLMCYDAYPGYSYQSDVAALIQMGIPANKIAIGLMPGPDDLSVMTSLTDVTNAANYVVSNSLSSVMFWDMNRDYNNITGLGPSATSNALYAVLK